MDKPLKTPLKSIRAKCLDYCCGSYKEVKECTASARINAPVPDSHFKLVLDMAFLLLFMPTRIRTMIAKRKNTPDLLIRRVGS